ncbi:hypothetical protein Bca52824_094027 [Brassica carinata]|uniref:Calcium uniporter protein C-terminal domain-containing protein n=1 Tax=Brassica carinata TaxID=52824 RepID=A0A8X7P6D3_BRACI|nr:hypothetical protein Bca52824_094027 [Brassica carinata]
MSVPGIPSSTFRGSFRNYRESSVSFLGQWRGCSETSLRDRETPLKLLSSVGTSSAVVGGPVDRSRRRIPRGEKKSAPIRDKGPRDNRREYPWDRCLRTYLAKSVTKSIEGLLPLPQIRNPNDPRRKELKELEAINKVIDQKSHSLVRRELQAGLGYTILQTALFMRLTFWELTWDRKLMEAQDFDAGRYDELKMLFNPKPSSARVSKILGTIQN